MTGPGHADAADGPCAGGADTRFIAVAAYGLQLAAAPSFAALALVTALAGRGADVFCATAPDASPLGGMTLMYLLMSVFHATPWLKLVQRV
jgi:hypothetical protein